MRYTGSKRSGRIHPSVLLLLLLSAGCYTMGEPYSPPPTPPCAQGEASTFRPRHDKADPIPNLPHELAQVSLPTYVIDAPDVLVIDAVRLIPKPPYRVNPLDVLGIHVTNTLPDAPIAGIYNVDPDGTLNLGFTYGNVQVEGMTLKEAKAAVNDHLLLDKLKPPFDVTVVLAESRGLQQVRGQHLVRPDGTVGLGVYGSVSVEGKTIEDAKAAIEEHLSQFVLKPEISLDVAGFNSKVYYVVTDGAGNGEQVARFPMTGKTTVLDALSQVNGLSPVSSKHCVYLVRPTPAACCNGTEEVFKVEWNNVVRRGCVATNYQVLPGDRIYLYAAPLITTDTYVARFLSPFERLFGAVGLGNSTVRQFLTPIPRTSNSIVTTPGF